MRMPDVVVHPRELSDYLLAHGRSVVTLQEVAEILDVGENHAASALVRLRRAHQVFSPARGLYVAIPPQFRTWGVIPAVEFIDPMMTTGGYDYYVGLLSAAELHGAAHQRPQVFQVMVDRALKDRDLGRVRLRFYQSAKAADLPVELRNTSSGRVRIATPAVVALDLASRPRDGAGLSNVATVIGELAQDAKLDIDAVLAIAEHYPASSLRRVGWLLDAVDSGVNTDPLAAAVSERASQATEVLLQPGGKRQGRRSSRWGLVENTDVEPDL